MSMVTSCTLLSRAALPTKLPRGALQSGKPAAVALQRKPRSLSVRRVAGSGSGVAGSGSGVAGSGSGVAGSGSGVAGSGSGVAGSGSGVAGSGSGGHYDHPVEVSMTLQYPKLTRSNYTAWAAKMEVFMHAQGIWEAVVSNTTDDRKNQKALAAIFQGIPEDILPLLAKKKKAKDAWDMLKTMYVGGDHVKKARAQTLMREFESLRMMETESIDDFAIRFTNLVDQIKSLGEKMEESYIIKKFLYAVPNKYLQIVSTIEQVVDSNDMELKDVISCLKVREERRNVPSGDNDLQP